MNRPPITLELGLSQQSEVFAEKFVSSSTLARILLRSLHRQHHDGMAMPLHSF
jgi:hypothetical protein